MGEYNLTKMSDLSRDDIDSIMSLAAKMKNELKQDVSHNYLNGKILAMYFEKPSLRTRITFETGIYQLGGQGIHLVSDGVGLGVRESVYDVAKNLERWVDLVMLRTFSQEAIEELAGHCSVPVINALSDEYHPCQALADIFTVIEHKGSLKDLTLTFLGDGNNICASLAMLCSKLGINFRHSGPADYQLKDSDVTEVEKNNSESGATFQYLEDPIEGVKDADLLYTDVWASMGQEEEANDRKKVFELYQLNASLAGYAKPDALIMHDLPAHRGEEITDEMMDCERSIVFDQAENRLHVQKGVMVYLYQKSNG